METENKDGGAGEEARARVALMATLQGRGGRELRPQREQNGADGTAQPLADGQLSARREAEEKAETPGPTASPSFAW